jgi:hypothetical protein
MKKILLVAAISAVASISSFGAACSNTTLNLLTSCTVGASDQWTLDTWGFGSGGSQQTGYTAAPVLSDIFVSFANLTSGGGGAGFSVTFSDGTGGDNFFSATSGSPNQTVSWKTIFVATGTAINTVTSTVTGGTTTLGNNGSVVLQKILTDATTPTNTTINDGTILTVSGFQSLNPLTIISGGAYTNMGVVDNYQISSGNAGSAALTSYTNTFFAADPPPPTNGVPEPMTFVLMGAGLVGIAALRRRNG